MFVWDAVRLLNNIISIIITFLKKKLVLSSPKTVTSTAKV